MCRVDRARRERSCRGNGRRLQLFFAAVDEEPRSSANKSLTLAVTSSMCVSLVSYLRIPREPVLLAFYPTFDVSSTNTYTMFLITDCLTSLDPCPLFEKGFDPSRRKEKWSCYFPNYNIRTGNFKVVYELDLIVIRFS